MKRKSKKVITGVTEQQYEESFAQYAKTDAEIQRITATMDLQITKIRDNYSGRITQLSDLREQLFELIQAYAIEHRETLFARRKSIEAPHGIIGFRTGTPKLKTLKGFTWNAVTHLLREFLPKYVRIEEEPAKDKLLADRDKADVSELFQKCGLEVTQDESFYIELKKESETL
jgi:phage host-nuclease inhibitor protein Gam